MRAFLSAVLVCAGSAVASAQIADVNTAAQAWAAAYSEGNVDALVSMYAPDAVYTAAATGSRAEGIDAIRKSLQQAVKVTKSRDITVEEVASREYGDILIHNFTWDYAVTLRNDKAMQGTGRSSVVYRNTPEGWYIIDHHEALNRPSRN